MALYLGLLIFAFIFTGVLIVPVIDLLFSWLSGRLRPQPYPSLPGGGLLLVVIVTVLFALLFPLLSRLGIYIHSLFNLSHELTLIFFSFLSFGSLGLISDLHLLAPKLFPQTISSTQRWQLKILLSLIISLVLFFKFNIHIINLPVIGVVNLGPAYILLALLVILSFSTAFSLTDDTPGLSGGLLAICLIAFWGISFSVLDTPISIFIALWLGGLIAFLYFNVSPPRLVLGETGRLAFGATLPVIGLVLGKPIALLIVGGLFMANLLCFILVHTPLHLWLIRRGWLATKVTLRAWLVGIILAIFGLWLAHV